MNLHTRWLFLLSVLAIGVAIAPGAASAQALPDLVVTGITLSPDAPRPLDLTTVRAAVRNQGGAPAGAFRVALRVDGRFAQSQDVAHLDAGESVEVAFSWFGMEGQRTLKVEVNPYNDVSESDTQNNSFKRTVDVLGDPLPDLEIASVRLSPTHPKPNQAATIEVVVRNVGRIAPSSRAVLAVKEGFKNLRALFIDPLGPGESASFAIPWQPRQGAALLSFEVDSQERIEELDEINNLVTELVNISTRPATGANLTVTELELIPPDAVVGQMVTIVATVQNTGVGEASNFVVGFEAAGETIASVQVSESVAAGAQTQVTASWRVPANGEHLLRAEADQDAVIVESTEIDNAFSTLVELGEPINRCGQLIYLRFDQASVQILSLALNLTEEQVRNVYLPKIKHAMDIDFADLNVRFSLSEPRSAHSTLRFVPDAPPDRLGQAPLDPGNVRKTDTGTVFVGSFKRLFAQSATRSLDGLAIIMANTASHEAGHFLGLNHDDLSVTQQFGGLNMMADGNDANFSSFFQDASFTEENLEYLRGILPLTCNR